MPCFHPITAYNKIGGGLTWKPHESNGTKTPVSCKQCTGCRQEYSRQWALRNMHEASLWLNNIFITLTYDNEHLPEHGTLVKKDFQNFIKRLRKQLKGHKIKYYACGEYGSITIRPHYHFIMFNLPIQWIQDPEIVAQVWTHGHVRVDPCNTGTIRYVTGYVISGKTEPLTDCDDRLPNFSIMSKHLGSNYLSPAVIKFHKERLEAHITLPGGFKTSMPRYYADRIFNKREKNLINEAANEARSVEFEKLFNNSIYKELIWKLNQQRLHEKRILEERLAL